MNAQSKQSITSSMFTPTSGSVLQRKCACGQHTIAGGECAECRQKREGIVQRAAVNTIPVNGVPPIVPDVSYSPDRPLDAGVQPFIEPHFSHDFSQVRVHTDAQVQDNGGGSIQLTMQLPGSIADVDDNHSLAQRIQNASTSGSSLDSTTLNKLEYGLNTNLSNVRIHTDSEADHLAHLFNAVAFTSGQDIFFRAGAYNPNQQEGMHLIAHEAMHTVQQSAGPVSGIPAPGGVTISGPSDPFEQAADQVADSVVMRFNDKVTSQSTLQTQKVEGQTEANLARAVQRQVSSDTTPVQRADPILTGPIILSTTHKNTKAAQKIANDAMKHLPLVGLVFLDEWYQAASTGAMNAKEPEDPVAKENWWIALAGNLGWAATSLFPEGHKVLSAVVSFAGAAVGSGAAARETAPSGKSLIGKNLAIARDNLEKLLRAKIIDVAGDAAIGNISNEGAQDRLLWSKLFPGIPYEARFQTLYTAALERANSVLEDFIKQWYEWKELIKDCALKKAEKNPFGLGRSEDMEAMNEPGTNQPTAVQTQSMVSVQRQILLFVNTPSEQQTQDCKFEHPFRPDLKFFK